MIPVLYPPNATDFSTFGLGVLTDTVSCEVTEERNGIFECLLKYPVSGQHYELIAKECIIKAKPNDTAGDQAFRIYRITKPLNGIVTIYGQHMSGRLLGGGDKEIIDRLAEINTELDAVAERRQAADKFFAKGLLDAAVYREELDELARKEKELHTVRAGIEGDHNLDSDRQRALNELLRYTAKAELLTAFSDEVFTKHVDRVIIFSRKEVGFAMKCGPVFQERI